MLKIFDFTVFIIFFKYFTGMEISKMKVNLKKLNETLKQVLDDKKETYSLSLQDYCPWLADFSGNRMNSDLEIPGQYDGKKLPLPQHHVKISGFHTNVCIPTFSLEKNY